jgi:hypothetical protein
MCRYFLALQRNLWVKHSLLSGPLGSAPDPKVDRLGPEAWRGQSEVALCGLGRRLASAPGRSRDMVNRRG